MKRTKTVYVSGMPVKSYKFSQYGFQCFLQERYDKWLGKNKVIVEVKEFKPDRITLTINRQYGNWYADPALTTHTPGSDVPMFEWDRIILMGDGYFEGGVADFNKHEGRYIIYQSFENITSDYKKLAKENHCTRIKSMEYTEALDHFDVTFNF